jgi:hypothetical protein
MIGFAMPHGKHCSGQRAEMWRDKKMPDARPGTLKFSQRLVTAAAISAAV